MMSPGLSTEQRQALELLASDPHGAGEELLVVAHGFDSNMIAGLRVGADQLSRVANARGFRSDLPAFAGLWRLLMRRSAFRAASAPASWFRLSTRLARAFR